MVDRRCTKTGCQHAAVATLTYVYADSTAVLGPLSPERFPGTYDLCRRHCDELSAPKGWEVVRLPDASEAAPPARDDADLMALADAVREVGLLPEEVDHAGRPASDPLMGGEVVVLAERRHLRVIADSERRQSSADQAGPGQ
ncbi:DUF3499 domain-containing protein [Luteococcus sp. OSA5]|uniref:DUF3499 domain-containing protein n=1 Tax=Luteococcus sp. OSA5 TaxID=3401630 RepID=UPI003B437668